MSLIHEKPIKIGIKIIQIADESRVVPISPNPCDSNWLISKPIIPPAPESRGTQDNETCILERQHVDSKTNKKAINLIAKDWTSNLGWSFLSIRLSPYTKKSNGKK